MTSPCYDLIETILPSHPLVYANNALSTTIQHLRQTMLNPISFITMV